MNPWTSFRDLTVTNKDKIADILKQLANGNTFIAYNEDGYGDEIYTFIGRYKTIDKASKLYWMTNTERRKFIAFFKANSKFVI